MPRDPLARIWAALLWTISCVPAVTPPTTLSRLAGVGFPLASKAALRPGFAPVGLAPGAELVAVCQLLSSGASNREWSTLTRLGFVDEMMIGTRLPTSGAIIKSSWALTWATTGAPPRTGMT